MLKNHAPVYVFYYRGQISRAVGGNGFIVDKYDTFESQFLSLSPGQDVLTHVARCRDLYVIPSTFAIEWQATSHSSSQRALELAEAIRTGCSLIVMAQEKNWLKFI